MTRITGHRAIDAPSAVVWDVVTDPDVYAAVAPNLASVEILGGDGEGMVRECIDTEGNAWTESCSRWEEKRGFAVAVDVETSDYHRRLFNRLEGTWSLAEQDEGVLVTMRFDFDAKYGPFGWVLARYFVEYKAPPLIEAIFDGWEAEVERRLAETEPSADGPHAPGSERRTNRLSR